MDYQTAWEELKEWASKAHGYYFLKGPEERAMIQAATFRKVLSKISELEKCFGLPKGGSGSD